MDVRVELLEILEEAEEDVKTGKIAPMEETFAHLRKELIFEYI